MKVRIVGIENTGQATEFIRLDILEHVDIGRYVICTVDKTCIMKSYWFPDLQVYKDDSVLLYTNSQKLPDLEQSVGSSIQLLYWELDHPVGNSGYSLVLMQLKDWQFFRNVKRIIESNGNEEE